MTLTARVSAFFLGWLGLTLVGFAAAVYFVSRVDLYQRADDRLDATLDALVAGAETDAGDVEWEPQERTVPRGGDGAIAWVVLDPDGNKLDRSGPEDVDWLASAASAPDGSPWHIARRRVDGQEPQTRPSDRRPSEPDPPGLRKYTYLEIVAAVPLRPVHDELRRLAQWLAALACGLWLMAVVIGRWLCRRTLAPVMEMAAAARELSPADPGERLAVRPTGDELEELGRAFNEALGRLEEAFERQRRFTGDASHQLRTPLAAVLGQVEVALRRDRDPAEYRDTLRSVADEVRHLHRLTESLLFLARADAEAVLPDLQSTDLGHWTANHVVEWRATHPDVRLDLHTDESVPTVRAHPELLAQLLDNLLDNAAKYGPAAGPIVVRVGMRDAEPELTVADFGPGLAPDDLPHIFDPFFRSAAARAAGIRGVGLGLAVARRIAEAMGARLTAEREHGGGSRFVLVFASLPS